MQAGVDVEIEHVADVEVEVEVEVKVEVEVVESFSSNKSLSSIYIMPSSPISGSYCQMHQQQKCNFSGRFIPIHKIM